MRRKSSDSPKQTNYFTYTEGLKKLTPREVEVLDLVEKGYLNNEIADELSLSIRTIQTHRNNICRKLGINGRGGLLKWVWLVRNGEND